MLKQVPAKCPRRRIWSSTPMQGQARVQTDPTHTLHSSFLLPGAFRTIQTPRVFSRPVIQIAFLSMARRLYVLNHLDSLISTSEIIHTNRMNGLGGCVLHPRTHKTCNPYVRVWCGPENNNYCYPIFPVFNTGI